MLTFYSESHRLHHGQAELIDGQMQPCLEKPQRMELILERIREVKLGEILPPTEFGMDPLQRIHTPGYLTFLGTAWSQWTALGRHHDALPLVWPVRGLRSDREPRDIDGKLGFYSMDAGVPITAGTWTAARMSAQVALSGLQAIQNGSRMAFALCRPPGHHAAADVMGGYCYLNNAAIAAQACRDQGAERVAILDVDYHHGNGTQSIFYQRSDVLFVSLHADPAVEYPYFLGYADERGGGVGEGCTVNYPLPHGTDWLSYAAALDQACQQIQDYSPDLLVVSLGLDTFSGDPLSRFALQSDDYLRLGARLAQLPQPTLVVMEGGYAVPELGLNTVNVLLGMEGA